MGAVGEGRDLRERRRAHLACAHAAVGAPPLCVAWRLRGRFNETSRDEPLPYWRPGHSQVSTGDRCAMTCGKRA